jgi:hypothetical protein
MPIKHQGSVAQWITRLTTNQEIAGSIPARLEFLIFFCKFLSKFLKICHVLKCFLR